MTTTTTDYESRARQIADALGLTVVAAFKGDRCPPWLDKRPPVTLHSDRCNACGSVHGDRYRVTLKFTGRAEAWPAWRVGRSTYQSLSFDFWASYQDKLDGHRPGYYDILCCVASEASMPTDPDEIAEEFGPMKPSQAIAIAKHAARLQAFFTEGERARLAEIEGLTA